MCRTCCRVETIFINLSLCFRDTNQNIMKIFKISISILVILSVFTFCNKSDESNLMSSNKSNLVQFAEKNCSCTASGTFTSCSVTCPVVDGVCLATCGTSSGTGLLFWINVAVCGCGSAGAGAAFVSDENLNYLVAAENVLNSHSGTTVNSVLDKIDLLKSFHDTEGNEIQISSTLDDLLSDLQELDQNILDELASLF